MDLKFCLVGIVSFLIFAACDSKPPICSTVISVGGCDYLGHCKVLLKDKAIVSTGAFLVVQGAPIVGAKVCYNPSADLRKP